MPDIDNRNLIDKSWDVFVTVQRKIGAPFPDEHSFVGGFMACFGIISGRVDIGLADDASVLKICESIHKDIHSFAQRVYENQRKQN